MAQAKEPFDWDNKRNLRRRALESVKEFFGKGEEEHPLSPETIAEASKEGSGEGAIPPEKTDPNEKRLSRETEQRRISENPATSWPG